MGCAGCCWHDDTGWMCQCLFLRHFYQHFVYQFSNICTEINNASFEERNMPLASCLMSHLC